MHRELSHDKSQGESCLNPRGNSRRKLLGEELMLFAKLSRKKLQNDKTAGAFAFVELGRATLFRPEDIRGYVEARPISRHLYR